MKILSPPESASIRLALRNEGRAASRRGMSPSAATHYPLRTVHYNIRGPNSSTTMDG
jgi:hypothetical protein